MAENSVVPFTFGSQRLQVILIDGEPWFVLTEVCRILEIANSRDAAARLRDVEKGASSRCRSRTAHPARL